MVAHGDIIPDLYSLLLFYRDCNADLMENQSMSPSIYFETGLGMYKSYMITETGNQQGCCKDTLTYRI